MSLSDCPRIQPQDLDAERTVLGAVLFDPSALCQAQELLTTRDFYDSRHQRIYDAMVHLAGDDEVFDLLTIGDLLDRKGELEMIGGRGVLAELLTSVASSVNIAQHCRIVHHHAIRRRLIKLSAEISQRAYEKESTEDLLRDTERGLFAIASGRDERSWYSLAKLAADTVNYVDQVSKRSDALIGIPTGYQVLNTLLGGWQRSDLVIVGARPSMGKTSLALGSALAAAGMGYRVGVISLEMSRLQLGLRLHGMQAPIDIAALRAGQLTAAGWSQLASTAQHLETLPFWVDDSPMLTVDKVRAKARHLKALEGLDLLVLDYLQLLQLPYAETRQQGIADASRQLKLLAKELDIPVLALSQLSRACELRDDKHPMLADLRDSGAIEQDADVVLLLYREKVYNPRTEEEAAEILVRKHRNGPIGDRQLRYVDRFARFEDWDQNPSSQE